MRITAETTYRDLFFAGRNPTLLYRGVDAEGRERTGRAHHKPISAWLEQRDRAGWQWIQVRDKRTGEVLARLGKSPFSGKRECWVHQFLTEEGAR